MISADKFTDASKRICALAMSDAVRLKHPVVGTEHLLAAIMGDTHNNAKSILEELGITGAQVLHQLLLLEIPLSRNKPPLDLAPIAEKVLYAAGIEAWDRAGFGHYLVDTEHFLLAMAKEDCAAIKMLEACGLPRAKLLAHVHGWLGQK